MKKYRITFADGREQNLINVNFDSRKEAGEELMEYIKDHNEHLDEDNNHLTPFDFNLEEVELNVSEIITDFETAREQLKLKPNTGFIIAKKEALRNAINTDYVIRLVQSLNPSHIEALIALNELFTIAEAWNKEDEFMHDFSNGNQEKWFPWFKYDKNAAGFVCANTSTAATTANAYFGSRLCFKTESRAAQFGKQFAHIYNKVFILNK